jgi:hypothetical protein
MLRHRLHTYARSTISAVSKHRARKSTLARDGRLNLDRHATGGKNTLTNTSVKAPSAWAAPEGAKKIPRVRSHACSKNALEDEGSGDDDELFEDEDVPAEEDAAALAKKHPSITIPFLAAAKAQFMTAL